MSDYSELKKRAMDATPGPWYEQDDEDSAAGAVFIMPTSDVWAPPICRITTEANAAYVAAANPSVILQLIAENERMLKILERTVEQYVPLAELEGVPGWSRVVKLDEVCAERDQLRAENAGLRTGYQAYERVNAELKAEMEALRKRIDDLSPFKGAPMTGPDTKCLACGGYHYGLVGLPCPKMNAVAQALSMENQRITPVEPLRVPHPLEAAMGNGEQS